MRSAPQITPDSEAHERITTTHAHVARVENVFLVLAVIFGMLFMFLTPPFQVPDEAAHFFRAYQISQGDFLPQKEGELAGGVLPSSLQTVAGRFSHIGVFPYQVHTSFAEIHEARQVPLRAEGRSFTPFSNTAAYGTPWVYAPQAAGIALGRLLSPSALDLLYFARLGGFLVWLLFGYWALRLLPVGKWALMVLLLSPMALFLAPSTSADSFVLSLTALVVAVALKLGCEEGRLSARDYGLLIAASAAIVLAKTPYSLAFLILLVIPASRFGGRKAYAMFGVLVGMAWLVATGGWLLAARGFYVPAQLGVPVSAFQQLEFLRHSPSVFITATLRMYIAHGRQVLWGFVGLLGQNDTNLPYWLRLAVMGYLTAGLLTTETIRGRFTAAHRWLAALVPVGIFVALHLLLYLSWTPVGAGVLEGMQGRYFVPVAMLLVPWLAMRTRFVLAVRTARASLLLVLAQVAIASSTLVVLVGRYY